MTVAVPVERLRQSRFAVRYDSFWRRMTIAASLIFSDLLCFLLADFALHVGLGTSPLGLAFRPPTRNAGQGLDLILLFAAVFVIARYLVGDYSRRQLFWDSARSTTGALLIGATLYLAASLLLTPHGFLVSTLIWLGLIVLLPAARQGIRYLLSKTGVWSLPTALFGTSKMAQEVYPILARQLALGMDLKWIVPESSDGEIPLALSGLAPLFASGDDIIQTLIQASCRQVVLIPDDHLDVSQTHLIDRLVGADIRVAIVPSLRRLPLFGLSTNYFFGKDFLLLQVRNNLGRLPQRLLKRMLDILGAVLLLVLLSPLMLILALMIKLDDGGPVFFCQKRIGRQQKDFLCWKFRTMVQNAESEMVRWEWDNPMLLAQYRESNFKLKADPRITRIGAWLRSKSLDELPQLFNVLLGEMSLVGPRPLLLRELGSYGPVITLYERVRPGITGLWQISGRSHTTFAERVSYDEWYIKNWTVWYDIVILLQTVWVLLKSEGAY